MTSEDQADGLIELNHLLNSWANERLMVHGLKYSDLAAPGGTIPVGIGVGGDIVAARPSRFEAVSYAETLGGLETPLRILTDSEFQDIENKSAVGVPTSVYVEQSGAFAYLWFNPTPANAFRVIIYTYARITEFASAATTVSLPDGYENAMAHGLAIQWAPMFGIEPSGTLQNNALMAVTAIKRINMQPSLLRCDAAVAGGGFNLISGDS